MENGEPESSSAKPNQLVEHFFRHETGRLHGALLRLVGPGNLQLAEDVAQEAMLRALRNWSMGGIPANPAAWITRVAMNLAKDALRHKRVESNKEPDIANHQKQTLPTPAIAGDDPLSGSDDALRLMFVCCHPEIAADAQIILALKIMCGFSIGEIAQAFFSSEAAIEKQLTRTKQRIRKSNIEFEIPEAENLSLRLNGVLGTLYLLFNEGYKATSGDQLLREDLCQEAIRLTYIVLSHPVGDTPRSHALLALMILSAVRFPTRIDESGALLRLEEQDRTKWNQPMIERGLEHLSKAAVGNELSEYHLQAGIAAMHCTAKNYASTNWGAIVRHYDALLEIKPSPVVSLNRAVAISELNGPKAGIEAIERMDNQDRLNSNNFLHAVLGELYLKIGDTEKSIGSFERALELATTKPERKHLSRRLNQVHGNA